MPRCGANWQIASVVGSDDRSPAMLQNVGVFAGNREWPPTLRLQSLPNGKSARNTSRASSSSSPLPSSAQYHCGHFVHPAHLVGSKFDRVNELEVLQKFRVLHQCMFVVSAPVPRRAISNWTYCDKAPVGIRNRVGGPRSFSRWRDL